MVLELPALPQKALIVDFIDLGKLALFAYLALRFYFHLGVHSMCGYWRPQYEY